MSYVYLVLMYRAVKMDDEGIVDIAKRVLSGELTEDEALKLVEDIDDGEERLAQLLDVGEYNG